MNSTLYLIATLVVPMVFAIVFHEIAHGWAARALGDPTAYERGRLSLNPLRHVDPMGTLILPGMLKLLGLPVFGWAKPVPVSYARLRSPKRDMALVAAAGPLTNFMLAALSAVAFGLLLRQVGPQEVPGPSFLFLADNLKNFIAINVFLGTFNLLPLPPFDGSRIVRGLAPEAGVRLLDRIEPVGIPLFMIVFIVLPWAFPGLHIVDRLVGPPMEWMLSQFEHIVALVAGPELD
ncbi:site-2 protease family protein [Novosphingobium sp.]|uniref:site-2 protease family protein n=1 Tax=Novosphingobium sp. TaxID=1874826 RepID=UPI001DC38CA0|nr:site-2 protease family protein [Novosphingobium sp.]MBX9664882.1 site-2 protease family protein [Novosphingobium sp.]